jgi:hypothetical protein
MSDYGQGLDWWLYLLDSLTQSMIMLYSTLLHISVQSHLCICCLVVAFHGIRSPSSGFPNCPQPQLLASNSNSSQGLNRSSPLTAQQATHSTPLYSTALLTNWAEAEAYCRQPAGTLTPGTGPRWDPWPYICSVSRPLFCFSFRWSSLLTKEELVFYIYIEWCLLTTPYSTWGYFCPSQGLEECI